MLVGISGAAGAGKDTIGSALITNRNYAHESFARVMKEALAYIFDWKMSDYESLEWKETPNEASFGLTPRQVLQSFGTEWGRNSISPDIWVVTTLRRLENPNTVITDVRFPNEAKLIRQAGGILLFVSCPDGPTTKSTGHESELWLPWLREYSDAHLNAAYGAVDKLQTVACAVVDGYERGDTPRFVNRQPETDQILNNLEEEILDHIARHQRT